MILKADLHLHSSLDPLDRHLRNMLSPYEILWMAKKRGFDVLSITHHDHYFYDKAVANYANQLGILLIPGIEKTILGKHVLLYNYDDPEKINSFLEIRKSKKADNLVICPHPFFIFSSINNELLKYLDVFDAIEMSHFYTSFINPNIKAQNVAIKFNKPLVGNSDMHNAFQFETTYTNIHVKDKNIQSIFNAIKNNDVEIISRPLLISEYCRVLNMLFEIEFNLPRFAKEFVFKLSTIIGKF